MSRFRVNNISGAASVTAAASVNPITLSSATTNQCSWQTSPPFPTAISFPDFVVVIAEPDTANEEVMHLFGFTPGGTTGWVRRAAEPNAGGSQVAIAHIATAWVHGPTACDFRSPSSRTFAAMAFR